MAQPHKLLYGGIQNEKVKDRPISAIQRRIRYFIILVSIHPRLTANDRERAEYGAESDAIHQQELERISVAFSTVTNPTTVTIEEVRPHARDVQIREQAKREAPIKKLIALRNDSK